MWCEGKERSIPLQVERKQSKHTRQRSDVATLSFTPVGDLWRSSQPWRKVLNAVVAELSIHKLKD